MACLTLYDRLLLLFFTRLVMSNSLWPHGLQHARLPCSSLRPRVCSNSCPLSQWCHSTISSSFVLFSFFLLSFPESGYFPMSRLFASGGLSIGASASSSVLPMNVQDWFPLGLTGLISLLSQGLSSIFCTTFQKHQFFSTQPLRGPVLTSVHDYWKNQFCLYGPRLAKWCLCFLICFLGLF